MRGPFYICAATVLTVMALTASGCGGGSKGLPPKHFESEPARLAAAASKAVGEGDYERAASFFARSLKVNRSVDNRQGELEDSINLGRVLIVLARYNEAKGFIDNAEVLAMKLGRNFGDDRRLAEVVATRAKLLRAEGDLGRALVLIDKAVSMALDKGGTLGGKLNLKADILTAMGRTDDAVLVLGEAVARSKKENSPVELANALRAKAALTGSVELFSEALDIDKRLGLTLKIGADLEGLGKLYLSGGEVDDGIFHLDRACKVYQSKGFKKEALECLGLLLELYEGAGDDGRSGELRELMGSIDAGR